MVNLVLYSIGCPNCLALKIMLEKNGFEFVEINDKAIMDKKGIKSSPILEVNGELLTFYEANKWIKERI